MNILPENAEYKVIISETNMDYQIIHNNIDVTDHYDNDFVQSMIHEMTRLRSENEYLKSKKKLTKKSGTISSPIGELTVDSVGMQMAIDALTKSQKKIDAIKSAAGYLQYVINNDTSD